MIRVNARDYQRQEREFERRMRQATVDSLRQSLTLIGDTAISDYMIPSPGPHGNTLGVRTTRLLRSIGDRISFADSDNGSRDGIREINVDKDGFSGSIGSRVPYAAIHEYGGRIPVTAKSRRFFWAKYYETQDEMWRNMALTSKTAFEMPARPFLEPAAADSEPKVQQIFQRNMDMASEAVSDG